MNVKLKMDFKDSQKRFILQKSYNIKKKKKNGLL